MRKYVSVNNLEIAGFSGASFDKRTYLFPRVIIEEDILQAAGLELCSYLLAKCEQNFENAS